jgi:hypothetical protein
MPRVKITNSVFKSGAPEYTAGQIVDVDDATAKRLERRGQATTKFEEPKSDDKGASGKGAKDDKK